MESSPGNKFGFDPILTNRRNELYEQLETELTSEEMRRIESFEQSALRSMATNNATVGEYLAVIYELNGERVFRVGVSQAFDEKETITSMITEAGGSSEEISYSTLFEAVEQSGKTHSILIKINPDFDQEKITDQDRIKGLNRFADAVRSWHSGRKFNHLIVVAPNTQAIPGEIRRNSGPWFKIDGKEGREK